MNKKYQLGDEELHRLLRAASQQAAGAFARPSDETILLYLEGRADELQRREVQEAVLCSPDFARELLEIAGDLEDLTSDLVKARADSVRVGRPPVVPDSFWKAIWAKLRTPLAIPRFVPVAVTVAVLLLAFIGVRQFIPSGTHMLTVAHPSVSADWFSGEWRSPDGAITTTRSSQADSAALLAARTLIKHDGDMLPYVIDTAVSMAIPLDWRPITVVFTDRSGDFVRQMRTGVPSSASAVTIWALAINSGPLFSLYNLPVTDDSTRVRWTIDLGPQAAAVLTYRSDGLFEGIPLGTFVYRHSAN